MSTSTEVSNFEIPSEDSLTYVKVHGPIQSSLIAEHFCTIATELEATPEEIKYVHDLCQLRKIPIAWHDGKSYAKPITEYLLPVWLADELNNRCPRGERDSSEAWVPNTKRDEFSRKYSMTVNVGHTNSLPRWTVFEPTETVEFTDYKTGKVIKKVYKKTLDSIHCPFPNDMEASHRNKMYVNLIEIRKYMALCLGLEDSDILLVATTRDKVISDKCTITFSTNVQDWQRQLILYWLSRRDFQCETDDEGTDWVNYQYRAAWGRAQPSIYKRR